jgi:hypothetical protein
MLQYVHFVLLHKNFYIERMSNRLSRSKYWDDNVIYFPSAQPNCNPSGKCGAALCKNLEGLLAKPHKLLIAFAPPRGKFCTERLMAQT